MTQSQSISQQPNQAQTSTTGDDSQTVVHDIGIEQALTFIGKISDDVFIADAQKMLFKVS